VLNWCAAPFGSKEYELAQYGVEGKHFVRAPDHSPVPTDVGRKEINGQYGLLGGRYPAVVGTADVPGFVEDLLGYTRATIKYMEPDLFKGIKIELPPNYSKLIVGTEDKIADVQRGRRPLSDLAVIVKDWRSTGGDEGREFLEKTLADNGR
jgi:putative aldouronate transport system substrate-binding protein